MLETANVVAQISNLSYRRFVTCGRYELCWHSADWKSAIQQIGNLRYDAAGAAPGWSSMIRPAGGVKCRR
jgi:hypothetical protein